MQFPIFILEVVYLAEGKNILLLDSVFNVLVGVITKKLVIIVFLLARNFAGR